MDSNKKSKLVDMGLPSEAAEKLKGGKPSINIASGTLKLEPFGDTLILYIYGEFQGSRMPEQDGDIIVSIEDLGTILQSVGARLRSLDIHSLGQPQDLVGVGAFFQFCHTLLSHLPNIECVTVDADGWGSFHLHYLLLFLPKSLERLSLEVLESSSLEGLGSILKVFPRLKRLDFACCFLDNVQALSAFVEGAESLEYLDAESPIFEDARGMDVFFTSIGKLKKLQHLSIGGTKLASSNFEGPSTEDYQRFAVLISDLARLTSLRLHNMFCEDDGDFLKPIAKAIVCHPSLVEFVFELGEDGTITFDQSTEDLILNHLNFNRLKVALGCNPMFGHWAETVIAARHSVDLLWVLFSGVCGVCPGTFAHAVLRKEMETLHIANKEELKGVQREFVFKY